MSYDITLRDPVTNEVCEVPAHLLTGGNYLAEYNEQTNTFSAKPNTEAWLNITYNYSKYFYEAMKAVTGKDNGIRELDGKEAVEFIPVISEMIDYIKEKYSDPIDGDENRRKWKIRKDMVCLYYDKDGKELSVSEYLYRKYNRGKGEDIKCKKVEKEVDEGSTLDYWEITAANAASALYKLKALIQLRPDGIISVD